MPLIFPSATAGRLKDSDFNVIVTGAGGWLGQATLEMLEQCFGDDAATRVHAFGASARELPLRSGRTLPCLALDDMSDLPERPYALMHYAFLTKDQASVMTPESFIAGNEKISDFVAGQMVRLGVKAAFIPSSGAVYLPDRSIDDDLKRNPYGAVKARDERRFMAVGDAENMRMVLCRVFNLAGPFINKLESYALGSILNDIQRGGPIRLRAKGRVERSYVHVGDVIALAFALLLGDKPTPAVFDTAGEAVIEVGDLARRAATLLGKPAMPIERPPLSSSVKPDRYVGDGRKMAALFKEFGITPAPLDTQILDTAAYLGLSKSA